MAAEASGRAFAATWRDERGEVVGTTYAGTMCLWPRLPWRIRFNRDGYEGVIPCRECPGCLELERLRLADRLHTKYGLGALHGSRGDPAPPFREMKAMKNSAPSLFVVRIYAPIELHAPISHKLHRRPGLKLEPGMWRLGATSFAVVTRDRPAAARTLTLLGLKHRIESLRLSRGRRAWRVLTAGLLVAREVYGEQRNRWYARGLPKLDRQQWQVKKIGQYQGYDRARSPRAWKRSGVVLVPPDVWRLCRTDRRALRGQLMRAADPEGVRRIMGLVADAISKARDRFTVSAAAKPLLSRAVVEAWYQRNAERSKARTIVTESDPNLPPLSEAGGYTSSEHSQGELMPRELERERRRGWLAAKDARYKRESQKIIERMKQLARKRGDPHV